MSNSKKSRKNYFIKAQKYDLLASHYKYIDPNLHVYYYHKHLTALNNAFEVMRAEDLYRKSPSRVRILHAATNAGNVDVYVNETRILQNSPYKTISDYLPLIAGKYQIDIYPTGQLSSTILSQKIQVEPGKLYTLAVSGLDKSMRLIAHEDLPSVPNSESKVRLIHLASDSPALDLAVKDGDVVFQNVPYRKATNYLGITPMSIDLETRVSGTKQSVLSIPHAAFSDNRAYTIYIIGLQDAEPGLEALFVLP
ncbi:MULTISPECIES: DUF4397 domain-containing protein [Bacillaceae]|uniref:DUF4397 domain-containing protein n=1 Tax=Peribacillus huizhouensis TaxID=1501239 RepID=A0ABR6CSY5_9BACI|nr:MULTISPECIES: DUF4397 domain-containing protein [Bacillaceae]MBA9027705.1 hypothetical protein [Peribacillus huizhouensis]